MTSRAWVTRPGGGICAPRWAAAGAPPPRSMLVPAPLLYYALWALWLAAQQMQQARPWEPAIPCWTVGRACSRSARSTMQHTGTCRVAVVRARALHSGAVWHTRRRHDKIHNLRYA